MNIRHSELSDIETIAHLVEEGRKIMRANGNFQQWINGYPARKDIEKDIRDRNSYLCLDDGKAVASFTFMSGPEPTYLDIYEGKWMDDETPYHVIHRLASTPDSRGVFSSVIKFCLEKTDNLRVDTHRDNLICQHNVLKHKFSYCGIIYLADGTERLAYQRLERQSSLSKP